MSITRRNLLLGSGIGIAGVALGAGAGIGLSSGRGWRYPSDVPRALQISTSETLPKEADVVVIGGGIAGISAALSLNERGLKTVVLEKGVIAGEQSGRAFGWVYTMGWPMETIASAQRGKEIWSGLAAKLGEDVGFRAFGNFTLLSSDDDVAKQEAWLKQAKEVVPQLDGKIIRGAELDALIPGASEKFKGALYSPTDGGGEPQWSVPRMAAAAIRSGVHIVAPCAARTIEREGGKVAGVHTERGYIKAKHVIVAAGAWTSYFTRNAGADFPLLAVNSSMQRVGVVDGALPGAGYGEDYTWRQMANGETSIGIAGRTANLTTDHFRYLGDYISTLTGGYGVKVRLSSDLFATMRMKSAWGPNEVSPFEEVRMLSATVDTEATDIALAALRRAYPQYEKAEVKETWAGMIDVSPDAKPYVDQVQSIPGLYVVCAMANGFTVGPAHGETLAKWINGEDIQLDPKVFGLARF